MNIIIYALRRPITIMVAIVAIAIGCFLALRQMPVDIFPSMNLPTIYVCQPYGGMDPAQMEGQIAYYYEYHFLYIGGIHHVESKNVQGMSLMKLSFHPGTNMSQAMAETIAYVNRARAFMPPGTVPPFVMRFDTGSVPVGYLVLSSETRSLGEIQDLALNKVRPLFASLPGVSAPPPFGASQRTIVINVDPDKLRAYNFSPDDIAAALSTGNIVSPSGNVHLGDKYPIVPLNSIVRDIRDMGAIPIRTGTGPTVYLRDVGNVEDATDLPTGYALFNGRRAIYILVTKRAEASTVSVVNNVRKALPGMRDALGDAGKEINVSFEFDQSPYVTRAIEGLATEGLLGAFLTGLMVLVFLRDWRSALVVVLNIPLALAASIIGLWLSGQTINLMTLGGLALAVGILVDEATVEIENIHTQMAHAPSIARAVRLGNHQTAVPRLLAMFCILAVFLPSFFMEAAARAMFVPMSLAVGFSMLASYLLSSTFVPVLSTWLLRHAPESVAKESDGLFGRLRAIFERGVEWMVAARIVLIPAYLAVCVAVIILVGPRLGMEIFPTVDAGQFRLRLRAPDGTHFAETEKFALQALDIIKEKVGADNVALSLGYVGMIPSSYPINGVFQWSRGPEEAILRVALKRGSGVRIEEAKETLRREFAQRMSGVRFSFEPGDIVNEVMSFGSATPIEIAVNGPDHRAFAQKIADELKKIDALRDLQFSQSLDYPTLDVKVDREKAGKSGVTTADVAKSLVPATSSSRFTVPNYWPDPKTGIAFQVQVQVPERHMRSLADLETIPVKENGSRLLVRDVSQVTTGTMPGQYDRYNMKREVSLTANIAGADLESVSQQVAAAIRRAGDPPKDVKIEVRGQIPPLGEMLSGLGIGLGLAVLVIFLLLAANFQSLRLAFVTVSTAPAVIAGVVLMLFVTRTTLNIQSFMGAIMAIGVAMANAILLVTFAEHERVAGTESRAAGVKGAAARLRPILMTSCAMTVGMIPMALGLGESGEQTSPLGRAVIGGLLAATFATLLVLPAIFAAVQRKATTASSSLDPDDPASVYYDHQLGDQR
jgi:multidrug efflux pump subunit AcrB